jgi:hypothetical protein
MATATSLTDERIAELMAGWNAVAAQQEELVTKINALSLQVETYQTLLTQFTDLTLPEIEALVAANSIQTGELRDNSIPNLEGDVAGNAADIVDLTEVTIPALQADVYSLGSSVATVGIPYRQDEPPEDLDPVNPILIGTRWYDTNNNSLEYFWNGTEWVEAGITIPDLSLTVQKFKTSTHQLY